MASRRRRPCVVNDGRSVDPHQPAAHPGPSAEVLNLPYLLEDFAPKYDGVIRHRDIRVEDRDVRVIPKADRTQDEPTTYPEAFEQRR